jgi:hypothetical protein
VCHGTSLENPVDSTLADIFVEVQNRVPQCA